MMSTAYPVDEQRHSGRLPRLAWLLSDHRDGGRLMLVAQAVCWTAVGTALAVLTAGCSSGSDGTPAAATTDRTATSSTTQGPGSFAWISSVMPTDAELTEALGYTVTTDGPPSVRPGRKFRNTFIGSGEVAERDWRVPGE